MADTATPWSPRFVSAVARGFNCRPTWQGGWIVSPTHEQGMIREDIAAFSSYGEMLTFLDEVLGLLEARKGDQS